MTLPTYMYVRTRIRHDDMGRQKKFFEKYERTEFEKLDAQVHCKIEVANTYLIT